MLNSARATKEAQPFSSKNHLSDALGISAPGVGLEVGIVIPKR